MIYNKGYYSNATRFTLKQTMSKVDAKEGKLVLAQ